LTGNPAGIVITIPQWFEECLARGCTVFHFPPNSMQHNIGKLDRAILLMFNFAITSLSS